MPTPDQIQILKPDATGYVELDPPLTFQKGGSVQVTFSPTHALVEAYGCKPIEVPNG